MLEDTVLKCLDFYLGITLQGLGKGFFLHVGCVFKDKNLMLVLLKYFASLHMFHNGNCSLLSTLAMGWKGFLLQCKPSSDVVFVQCHFAATSRCLLCFFVLAPCFPCPVGVHILSAHTTRTL